MSAKPPAEGPSSSAKSQNVVFFHPDLGIGGAERLIVDAAVGLQDRGHKVTIFTSHCDPKHCFEEARNGILDVRVRGNTLFPHTVLNRFHILLAILRQLHLVITIAVSTNELQSLKPDVFIVDQLPSCIPLLRWLFPKKQRTLFYCHFPDQLLVQKTNTGVLGVIKDIYRLPFDWFEGWSMSGSDRIVVNSKFTKSVANKVFPRLNSDLGVIYPCVTPVEKHEQSGGALWDGAYKMLLSINRFERKKDIGLAIKAYRSLPAACRASTRLIIAGGYDSRVAENVQCHKQLLELAGAFSLRAATATTIPTALAIPSDVEVLFLLSIPGPFKETLLRNATMLVYTPTNEHFGIVPIEAMQYGVPVLASNTGGPLETIVDGETGWLRDAKDSKAWTEVMRKVLEDMTPAQLKTMGAKGKQRVQSQFTRPIMAQAFESNVEEMLKAKRSKFLERNDLILMLGVVGIFMAALVSVIIRGGPSSRVDRRATEFVRIHDERQ